MTEPFVVEQVPSGGRRVVLSGRVTVDSAVKFHAALVKILDSPHIEVDCTDSDHLDGAAVQILLSLKKDSLRTGRSFKMKNPPGKLGELLAAVGLH